MRSSPTNNNNTLLRIQQEISEVTARENELRSLYQQQHSSIESESDQTGEQIQNEINRSLSPATPPVSPSPPVLTRSFSSTINTTAPLSSGPVPENGITQNGINTTRRLFIPNPNSAKGVMQKFFKTRGKLATVAALSNNISTPKPSLNNITWHSVDVLDQPAKALIPADKPLRKGYVPVEQKIQKELRELKQREEELRSERRISQPDLMAALTREQEDLFDSYNSQTNSRSSSPVPLPGRLRNSRSFSQLLDEENYVEDTNSMPNHPLRPARSLAELCDVSDEEVIEKPKNLIQQWESRIRQSQESNH